MSDKKEKDDVDEIEICETELELHERNPDAIVYREYEAALIGIAEGAGMSPVAAYDYDKCIEILEGMGMTYEDAIDYFCFNSLGAHYGDRTPIFINLKD